MPPSNLPAARQAFVAAVQRDTPGTDLPRFVAVLDELIAWSVARPGQLVLRSAEKRADVIAFERTSAKAPFWSAQVTRGAGPRLEIHLPPGAATSAEERTAVRDTLNRHSREVLLEGDRLRIGFGALKNVAGRAAVLALMEDLLAGTVRPAEAADAIEATVAAL